MISISSQHLNWTVFDHRLLTCVTLFAVAYDLIRCLVSLTGMSIKVIWIGVTRTGAGATVLPWAKHRVSKEPIHTAGTNERDINALINNLTTRGKRNEGLIPNCSYRSQSWPAVLSLQSLHRPVWGSQISAWPLHWQALQLGKPHWPGWQSEHWRPAAPCLHGHWPVTGSHWWLKEPSEWQSQAGWEG